MTGHTIAPQSQHIDLQEQPLVQHPDESLPAEDEQAQAKREEAEAASKLRKSIENNEGYFQPQQPLGYVLEHDTCRYTIVGKAALGVGVFSVVWPCADSSNK